MVDESLSEEAVVVVVVVSVRVRPGKFVFVVENNVYKHNGEYKILVLFANIKRPQLIASLVAATIF